MEFDSNKIESNSIGVEFDSIALKQDILRLRLDIYFLILTGRKGSQKSKGEIEYMNMVEYNKINIDKK